MPESTQLAREIYLKMMSVMKYTLDLEEFSYKEKGRDDPRFKFFKKQLMEYTYNTMRSLFMNLEDLELIEQTEHEEDVKDGFKQTPSGGSGYINTDRLNKIIKHD
jgi:hypothetical protein